jgi:hypothetical protein
MPGIKRNVIAEDMPPRHHADNALCMQAALHGTCPLSHEYHGGALTEADARWLYVERMLEEVAAFEPDCGADVSGAAYEVDEVARNENGAIVTIFGTTWRPLGVDPEYRQAYILGDV